MADLSRVANLPAQYPIDGSHQTLRGQPHQMRLVEHCSVWRIDDGRDLAPVCRALSLPFTITPIPGTLVLQKCLAVRCLVYVPDLIAPCADAHSRPAENTVPAFGPEHLFADDTRLLRMNYSVLLLIFTLILSDPAPEAGQQPANLLGHKLRRERSSADDALPVIECLGH